MPSISTLSMPPDLAAVHAANVDDDPQEELILESREPAGEAPDKVRLTILHFGTDGSLVTRHELPLGNKAQLWDADGSIVVLDRDGLLRYNGVSPTRVVSMSTPLAALGPTTPARSRLLHDLDGDKKPESVFYAAGKLHSFRPDGSSLGAVAAAPEGSLSASWENGGESTRVTIHSPSLNVADVDGDGWQDLLHPSHRHLRVWFGGPAVGARSALLNLPFDLEPRDVPAKEGEVRREITGVWFKDINGDKRVDLAVQRLVIDGSFFGATSELVYCQGTGNGFAAPVILSTASAAFGVALEDFDGDGDQDWIVPEVDVGFGNLARALVSRVVRVNLRLYRYASGFSSGVSVRELSYPLGTSGKFQATYDGDVNGDGRRDLVTNEGEDRVRVFAGTAEGLSSAPLLDQELRVPVGNDTIFTHDLTGDKAAEILVWGPNEATATLIRLP